ncbi:MAG: aspartyl-phosphate phosphatase Spo0E family protein [Eubacterium sp.]|nr:aspartyl-phosphate phosphatase Spo0E family protein [Eubacterium sp.]
MNQERTLRSEIEHLRNELNEAALRGLNSEECFRLSLKLDAVLEDFITRGEPPL